MYGKKPPFSMKPHFPTLNPTNMPADFPRLNTPSGQNFPSLQQFSIFSLPPKQSSSISSNDMQYITPGKYAVLGFFADSHKTTKTDRFMATQIGQYFCCHTCGRAAALDARTLRDVRNIVGARVKQFQMFLQGPRDEFRRVADSRPARIVLILKAPARIRKIPQQFFHKDALRLHRRPRSVLFHIFLHALPRGNVPYVCLCVPRGVRLQIAPFCDELCHPVSPPNICACTDSICAPLRLTATSARAFLRSSAYTSSGMSKCETRMRCKMLSSTASAYNTDTVALSDRSCRALMMDSSVFER